MQSLISVSAILGFIVYLIVAIEYSLILRKSGVFFFLLSCLLRFGVSDSGYSIRLLHSLPWILSISWPGQAAYC